MSTTPFGTWISIVPISSGANTPRPPPSIIAGPPMPMFESFVAMITSQQPSSEALPAKQRPVVMPTMGTRPLSVANCENVRVRPSVLSVSPGRPPPPSPKRTTGSLALRATWIMRSVLAWLRLPCVPAKTV